MQIIPILDSADWIYPGTERQRRTDTAGITQ